MEDSVNMYCLVAKNSLYERTMNADNLVSMILHSGLLSRDEYLALLFMTPVKTPGIYTGVPMFDSQL